MHQGSDSVAQPTALVCMHPRSFGFDRPSPCRRLVWSMNLLQLISNPFDALDAHPTSNPVI